MVGKVKGGAMDLEAALRLYPGAESIVFGDGPALSARLIGLVRHGRKRATCGALRDFVAGEAMPMVGRCDIVRDWDGQAQLVIRTVSVETLRFCDVGAEFALAEGEDETLEGWRAGHRDYFTRNGGFDAGMMLICERFDLVEDLAKR